VTVPYARHQLYPRLLRTFTGMDSENSHVGILATHLVARAHQIWRQMKGYVEDAMSSIDSVQDYHAKPMTGFFALFFAAQVCEYINLYGFSKYSGRPNEKYHYFDAAKGVSSVHSFDLANEIFRIMAMWPESDLYSRIRYH
ncbi:glycosyltransferase 29 protein, partial [Cymbomonas tetramitiformis]